MNEVISIPKKAKSQVTTFTITKGAHKKLRILAALKEKSMSSLVSDMILQTYEEHMGQRKRGDNE